MAAMTPKVSEGTRNCASTRVASQTLVAPHSRPLAVRVATVGESSCRGAAQLDHAQLGLVRQRGAPARLALTMSEGAEYATCQALCRKEQGRS
jgi:hypothetical protein